MKNCFLSICILLFIGNVFYIHSDAQCINIKDQRELFLNNYLIEKLENSCIKMHQPVRQEVAFYFNEPWEGSACSYVTILKDSTLYRAYYRGQLKVNQTTCIAESRDGIIWYKPELSLFNIPGYGSNNIVLLNEGDASHNFTPFRDLNPDCDHHYKYKGIGGKEREGLFLYQSSDGIKWEKVSERPFFTDGNFDSQNVAFWSEEHETYFLFFRKWVVKPGVKYRSIAVTTSKDFKRWSKLGLLEFGDKPIENLYTNQIGFYYRAPHIFIGIGARLFEGKKVLVDSVIKRLNIRAEYSNDCSDVYFMSSRDGVNFDRFFMESFIRPGIGYNNWSSRTNYPALNVIETSENELSIYVNENYLQPDACLRRFSIRKDGFASIYAGYNGGFVVTKSILFSGNNLEINYSTSAAGEIQIELLDENYNVIKGFSKEDCDVIVGDEISRVVTWRNRSDLSDLNGNVLRMKFYLKDADIFSFKYNIVQ